MEMENPLHYEELAKLALWEADRTLDREAAQSLRALASRFKRRSERGLMTGDDWDRTFLDEARRSGAALEEQIAKISWQSKSPRNFSKGLTRSSIEPTPSGKCSYMVVLSEKERRALEALAHHPDGCDEAVLLADGCTVGS
jgi:hypothetical protein